MNYAMRLKDRIKNLARKHHVPAQAVLQNFMLERLLERISLSSYKDQLILKGGLLVASMIGITNRTTMDMDATLRGSALNEESIRQIFMEICSIPMVDQVTLEVDHAIPIREDTEYGGIRVAIIAGYESIRTPLKIDITTGDVITPAPIKYDYPSLFEDKRIEIWAYNIETILAEKVETILSRGILNTRPRDYYDVFYLWKTRQSDISHELLIKALDATSLQRGSRHILKESERILQGIQSDPIMRERWMRYCSEYLFASGIPFDDPMRVLIDILGHPSA